MSFEVIKCPACGSPEVMEYRAGSYICRHCDTAFKHVEPSPAAVTVRSEFCRCGNLAQGQCGTCRSGICERCVWGRAEDARHHDPLTSSGGWFRLVAVASGGYQLVVGNCIGDNFSVRTAVGSFLQWRGNALVRGDWRPVQVGDSGVIAGYVPAEKVWDYVGRSGARGYVCLICLSEAGERVCAELVSGAVCMNPFCGQTASGICPCCREPNCGQCLYASLSGYKCPPEFKRTLEDGNPQASIQAPPVCASCYTEYKLTAADLEPIPKVWPRRNAKAHAKAWTERNELVAEEASEISMRWNQQLRKGCQRQHDSPSGTIRYRVIHPH
jgi:hypothetical protein